MNKRRRIFKIYRENNDGRKHLVAHGVLYDEGNVQVLWRKDIGHTAEQYANIGQTFGLLEGSYLIEIQK